jgi:hypothetical protein
MLAAPVIAGVVLFGLMVWWDAMFYDASSTAGNKTNGSQTYGKPVTDGSNGTALFYGSDMPTYLEERIDGSEYTLQEDNRTVAGN